MLMTKIIPTPLPPAMCDFEVVRCRNPQADSIIRSMMRANNPAYYLQLKRELFCKQCIQLKAAKALTSIAATVEEMCETR